MSQEFVFAVDRDGRSDVTEVNGEEWQGTPCGEGLDVGDAVLMHDGRRGEITACHSPIHTSGSAIPCDYPADPFANFCLFTAKEINQ